MDALILTRDEGAQLRSFEGKRVVPLDAARANYREWLVTIGPTEYCIIDDHDTWTVLYYAPDVAAWCATVADVAAFLATHKLILAA